MQWGLGVLFGFGGIAGEAIGSKLVDRVSAARLRLGFAGVALAVAVAMAWQALSSSQASS